MRSRSKHLTFITATLLLSIASPLFAFTYDFKPLSAQAQTAQDRKAEAYRLFEEASKQIEEGQFQKALESLEQALPIYREIAVIEATPKEIRLQERDILFGIGWLHLKLGQYDQIPKIFRQILAIDRELGDRCHEQEILFKISAVYGVLGQYDQVLEGLEKIQAINRELDEPCRISLLYEISDIYQRLGQPDQALKTLEQRLAFVRKVGDRKQEKLTLLVINRLYQQQRQYEQALAALQKVLSINRELGDRSGEGGILIRIGEIYEQQGQYEQALQSYQQALTINRQSNRSGVATLMTLSRVYQRLGHYEQALESYQKALAADRKESSGSSQASQYLSSLSRQYIHMSLSQVHRKLGQDEQAQESYQQALAIGKKLGNFEPSIRALNDWGSMQARNRQFTEALETFEKALALGKEVALEFRNSCGSEQPKPPNLGVARLYSLKLGAGSKCGSFMGQSSLEGAETLILKNLGFVYRKLGQPEKSRQSYEQALNRYQQKFAKLKESNEDCWLEDELRIPREIAQVYEILGEHNLARDFYRQAEKLEFVQNVSGAVCDVLGDVGSGIVLTDDDDSSPPRQSK